VGQGLSSGQIAKKYKCERTAILNRLREYHIPLRHPKNPLNPDKKILHNLYIVQNLSPYKIAEQLNCSSSTIRNWLKIYKFPIRKKRLIKISKTRFSQLYYHKKLSLKQIGDKFGYTSSGIFGAFKRFKLPLRSTSQSSKYHFLRSDFNGDKSQMAYLIGFRIGDLHVRKEKYLVRVGCGTTQEDQLTLIQDLFKKYGKVYIGSRDKRGAWHPEVSLNRSFDFLTPKHRRIPLWISNSRKYFISFLAGYCDAEGNIGCYPRARFKIASYDYGILKDITKMLKKYLAIQPVLFLEKIDRMSHNQDALSIIVNERYSLLKLLTILMPILKHKNRKRGLRLAIKNIQNRIKKYA